MTAKQLADYINAMIKQGDLDHNAIVTLEQSIFVHEVIDAKPDSKKRLQLFTI